MTKFQIKGIDSFNSASANLSVRKVSMKAYRQYETDYFFSCLLEYASSTDTTSITAYVKSKKGISKSSFLCYYHKSGLSDYKKHGAFDPEVAKLILAKYFETTNANTKTRILSAQDSCCYLTANEEKSLVQTCTVLGAMGYGLTKDDLYGFADALVNKDVDKRECIWISKHVTDGMLLRHKDLVKVVAAASLDPKRAQQATGETRDTMFSKLNSYIQILNAMGELPWKKYNDIPSNAIYNMDELGNDTMKHQNKILTKKQKLALRKQTQHVPSCAHPKVMDGCLGISPCV